MRIFLCFCFFCLSFSAFAQKDSTKIDSLTKRDSILTARRDSIFTARRDSIVNSVGKGLGVSKSKIEAVLAAFAAAADNLKQVSENDELDFDEKSTQLKAIAEQRDVTLKSLLTEAQLEKVKAYIIRRKIPKKLR